VRVCQVPLVWEEVDVTPKRDATGRIVLPPELFDSMARTRVGLKGAHHGRQRETRADARRRAWR
jgi:hypothetical protein